MKLKTLLSKDKKKGIAIIFSLIMLAAFMTIGMTYVLYTSNAKRDAIYAQKALAIEDPADHALAEALVVLRSYDSAATTSGDYYASPSFDSAFFGITELNTAYNQYTGASSATSGTRRFSSVPAWGTYKSGSETKSRLLFTFKMFGVDTMSMQELYHSAQATGYSDERLSWIDYDSDTKFCWAMFPLSNRIPANYITNTAADPANGTGSRLRGNDLGEISIGSPTYTAEATKLGSDLGTSVWPNLSDLHEYMKDKNCASLDLFHALAHHAEPEEVYQAITDGSMTANLDINTATHAQLMALPYFANATDQNQAKQICANIIDYRDSDGLPTGKDSYKEDITKYINETSTTLPPRDYLGNEAHPSICKVRLISNAIVPEEIITAPGTYRSTGGYITLKDAGNLMRYKTPATTYVFAVHVTVKVVDAGDASNFKEVSKVLKVSFTTSANHKDVYEVRGGTENFSSELDLDLKTGGSSFHYTTKVNLAALYKDSISAANLVDVAYGGGYESTSHSASLTSSSGDIYSGVYFKDPLNNGNINSVIKRGFNDISGSSENFGWGPNANDDKGVNKYSGHIRNADFKSLSELGNIHRGENYRTLNMLQYALHTNGSENPAPLGWYKPMDKAVGDSSAVATTIDYSTDVDSTNYNGGDLGLAEYLKVDNEPIQYKQPRFNPNVLSREGMRLLFDNISAAHPSSDELDQNGNTIDNGDSSIHTAPYGLKGTAISSANINTLISKFPKPLRNVENGGGDKKPSVVDSFKFDHFDYKNGLHPGYHIPFSKTSLTKREQEELFWKSKDLVSIRDNYYMLIARINESSTYSTYQFILRRSVSVSDKNTIGDVSYEVISRQKIE